MSQMQTVALLRGEMALSFAYKLAKDVSNRGAVCRAMDNVPVIILLPLHQRKEMLGSPRCR